MTGYLEARRRLEAKIEELIALLDLLDGDPDLEDNGDLEPSLGVSAHLINGRAEDDLEYDPSETDTYSWENPMALRMHIPEERAQLNEQWCRWEASRAKEPRSISNQEH